MHWRVPKTCGNYPSCIGLERDTGIVRKVTKVNERVCKDRKDIKFLECAVSGKADYIVSGDRDLISVGEIGGIRIITPAELRKLLET